MKTLKQKKGMIGLKNNKGITLIALVITIIVMLILVTVTIRVATTGNLFSHAGNAAKETKRAAEHENDLASGKIGETTIESIVEEQVPTIIHFTIGGNPYSAVKGWTWERWCDSDYNPGKFFIQEGGVHTSRAWMSPNGEADHVIIDGYDYELYAY